MTYYSTKRYDNVASTAFRQWRAESHCHLIHGYALSFEFIFAARELDIRNWVVDFGSLKSLKGRLEDLFDHKLIVAADDPDLEQIKALAPEGIADVRVHDNVGCEAFAETGWILADMWLDDNGYSPRVWIDSVRIWEHTGNSAIYKGDR